MEALNSYILTHQLHPENYKVLPATDAEQPKKGQKFLQFCVGEFVSAVLLEDHQIWIMAPANALLAFEAEVPLNVLVAIGDHRYSSGYESPDDYPTNNDLDPELEKLGFTFEGLWQ